jgi:hypothetical protein
VSIEPFSGIRWTDGANSPPLCDFRANLDNFGRIDIVANHVGIVETENVVEATAASWARYLGQGILGLRVHGEFAICLF